MTVVVLVTVQYEKNVKYKRYEHFSQIVLRVVEWAPFAMLVVSNSISRTLTPGTPNVTSHDRNPHFSSSSSKFFTSLAGAPLIRTNAHPPPPAPVILHANECLVAIRWISSSFGCPTPIAFSKLWFMLIISCKNNNVYACRVLLRSEIPSLFILVRRQVLEL